MSPNARVDDNHNHHRPSNHTHSSRLMLLGSSSVHKKGRPSSLRWMTVTFCLTLPLLLLSLFSSARQLRRLHRMDSSLLQHQQMIDAMLPYPFLKDFFPSTTNTTTLRILPINESTPKIQYRYETAEIELPLQPLDLRRLHQWIEKQQQQPYTNTDSSNSSRGSNSVVLHAGRPQTPDLESYSSLDYMACCGLGHRLGRMSDAYHVAKQLGLELRSFWGWCSQGENKTEIFSSLFDPTPANELSYVTSSNLRVAVANTVPGYTDQSPGSKYGCLCRDDKIASDLEFFTSLRHRFKRRHDVDQFVSDHFAGKLSLSLHIRAGNGETGDFAMKQRQIANANLWIANVADRIRELVANATVAQQQQRESVLFVATDTPSYIDRLREALNGTMPVVVWDQDRPEEGSGVFFGLHGAQYQHANPNECLRKWEDTLMDQILFSSADVVIAGKTSTFSQTLPLSLAFGRSERKFPTPYCEIRGEHGESSQCFESYQQWCCEDRERLSYEKQKKMVRHVVQRWNPKEHVLTVGPRSPDQKNCHPRSSRARELFFCLPHTYERTLATLQ